jgi:hypothetical protein
MSAGFTKTVTLVRRTKGPVDKFGNDTFVDSASPVVAVVGIINGGEQVQGRDTATMRVPLYLPPGTVVTHLDAVIMDGERWEIDGVPTRYQHALTGWTPGVEINCRRVTG